ncbi:MAG: site-specific DNA-methyltransferase [Pseudomonadota bacterium]
MKQPIEKLKGKLSELFQLDQADLDFGIYRIMNAKRGEINRFLEKDLLPQVKDAFSIYKSADKTALKADLDKAIEGAKSLGVDPDSVLKIKELQTRYDTSSVDLTALENEVYSRLYDFFSRYYDSGDFISLRRYKKDVYAIPYEGEEVKLHWATADQYYIKTMEYFRDYAFKVDGNKLVHFKIIEADTEKDNIKAANGNDRRFFLREDNPVVEEKGELVICFEYRPDPQKRKQEALNAETIHRILGDLKSGELVAWQLLLTARIPTNKNPNRTALEKHLADYTRRNTFDYFIHKDLGGFLQRELDFYIKNEIMHLDDVENESAPRVEQYLSKIKVIRKIAHKIIDFLAQIEDFQKKLWLKKKFVIETNYCITLDRVPEELYTEIAANEAQHDEWVKLFAIDEIERDLSSRGYSKPLTIEFLKANNKLVLDTQFFDEAFKARLIAAIENLDEQCDGLLIHSENFQALNLLQKRYRQQVKCIYIDPPYNTGGDGFSYKDGYQHSTWLSLLAQINLVSLPIMSRAALLYSHIDDNELDRLKAILSLIYGEANFQSQIAWKNKYGPGAMTKGFGSLHEHILVYSNESLQSIEAELSEEEQARYNQQDEKFPTRGGFVTQPLATKSKDDRPNLIYPINYQGKEIWPDKQWIWAKERMEAALANNEIVVRENNGKFSVRFKQYLRDENGKMRKAKPLSLFLGPFNQDGTFAIEQLFGERAFSFPKPYQLAHKLINIAINGVDLDKSIFLDYFAGSGTTGHAVINLNREDGGKRKYILVEMGDYFDTVLVPRIKKVIYSKDWKDGKPTARHTGISHCFKYIRLESYEDTLANLELKRTDAQKTLLDLSDSFRESYMLKYMLDTESSSSQSLLNIDAFEDPLNYKLLVGTGSVGETRAVNVDLVETFNWLLGIRVRHMDHIRGFRVIEGMSPEDEKVLIIWRNIKEKSNQALDDFFRRQQYNTMDMEFDLIYVNGNNNLMNLPMAGTDGEIEPRYKVRLIEEEFKRLMFDVKDV